TGADAFHAGRDRSIVAGAHDARAGPVGPPDLLFDGRLGRRGGAIALLDRRARGGGVPRPDAGPDRLDGSLVRNLDGCGEAVISFKVPLAGQVAARGGGRTVGKGRRRLPLFAAALLQQELSGVAGPIGEAGGKDAVPAGPDLAPVPDVDATGLEAPASLGELLGLVLVGDKGRADIQLGKALANAIPYAAHMGQGYAVVFGMDAPVVFHGQVASIGPVTAVGPLLASVRLAAVRLEAVGRNRTQMARSGRLFSLPKLLIRERG